MPSCDILTQLGWMNISQRYTYFTGITMYKSLSDSATTSLQNLFSYVNKDHYYNTRSDVNGVLIAPRCNLEIFTQSLSYSGPSVWNNIPHEIKDANNVYAFKRMLKNYILNTANL